jgi:hypothetical protein
MVTFLPWAGRTVIVSPSPTERTVASWFWAIAGEVDRRAAVMNGIVRVGIKKFLSSVSLA